MPTSVLMVTTATEWLGAARMPRDLANAGFAVSLLVPPGSVAEKSRFLIKIGHLPANATPAAWVEAFVSMVESTSPRLVLPCDDTSLRLLMLLALSPPATMLPTLRLQLAALIVDSLGDPAFYRASIDKTMIGSAAAALGLRVPPSIVVTAVDQASQFIATHGFPIVIKRSHSTAGESVVICADQAMVAIFVHRKCMRPRRDSPPGSASAEFFRPNSSWIRQEESRISSRSTGVSRTARTEALA